ncbi:MAG: prenyltransferase [Chloroflexi bacterium]|nr:prenyltransferase [Chloroflexota bacterium]
MSEQTTPMGLAPGSIKTWFLEIRGPFLALSLVLAPIGTAIAWHDGSFHWGHFLLAWVGAILAHVSVNVFNEYFDYLSGLDFETQKTPFSGGSGILTAGLIEPRQTYLLGMACLFIDAVIGTYFVIVRGWGLLPVILLGGLFAYFYTPYLSRWQIGELAAGLGLGSLVVLGAYFVQTGQYTWEVIVASLAPGFLTANLLLLNEFPDVEADRRVGRRNLVMALGRRNAAWLYTILLACTYLSIVLGVVFRLMPWPALVTLLTVPVAMKAIRGALQHYDDIPRLVPALGANVLTILATDALLTVGYVLATVFGL